MGCSKSLLGRRRRKYIQHVRGLYPRQDQPQYEPSNLSSLVHYAVGNPKYLQPIGAYILRRLEKHIRRGEEDRVHVIAKGLNALIDSCGSDVTKVVIFEDAIRSSILLLLDQQHPQYNSIAADTFIRYAMYQDEEEAETGKLDIFFTPLTKLCLVDQSDPIEQKRQRLAGLCSLKQMILFNDSKNTFEHMDQLIPAILKNIKKGAPESEVTLAALECLEELSRLIDLTSVIELFQPLFSFLSKEKWTPIEFSLETILFIVDNARNLPNSYAVLYEMLKVSATLSKQNPEEQLKVLQILQMLIVQMQLPLGPWHGLLSLLIQQLREASALHFKMFWKIVQSFCHRMPNPSDPLQMVDSIADVILHHSHSPEFSIYLLQGVLKAAQLTREISELPEIGTMRHLLTASQTVVVSARIQIVEIMSNLLVPLERELDFQNAVQNGNTKVDAFVHSIARCDPLQKEPRVLSPDDRQLISIFLHKEFIELELSPLQLHLNLLVVLLHHQPQHVLNDIGPLLVFLLSESSLVSFCMTFFWFVARVFSPVQSVACSELESFSASYLPITPPLTLASSDLSKPVDTTRLVSLLGLLPGQKEENLKSYKPSKLETTFAGDLVDPLPTTEDDVISISEYSEHTDIIQNTSVLIEPFADVIEADDEWPSDFEALARSCERKQQLSWEVLASTLSNSFNQSKPAVVDLTEYGFKMPRPESSSILSNHPELKRQSSVLEPPEEFEIRLTMTNPDVIDEAPLQPHRSTLLRKFPKLVGFSDTYADLDNF